MTLFEAIEIYQEPGAIDSFDPTKHHIKFGWKEHRPATFMSGVGRIMTGMPNGFNRIGPVDIDLIEQCSYIYTSWSEKEDNWKYDIFNIPCWKYLDEHNNTLVRGLCPRSNRPFLHIIIGDHRNKINCLEITHKDIQEMD